jgi:hypothetical protein
MDFEWCFGTVVLFCRRQAGPADASRMVTV